MGCLNLHSFFFLILLPRAPSMVFGTCQSKCPSRCQVPMTLLATREQGSFHAEILRVSQTNYVFVFAGKCDSSRGVAGTKLAWCWGPSAFQSHWTERGPLASVWWQKKRVKMRPQDFIILTFPSHKQERCATKVTIRACLSRRCHQHGDLFILILQIQIILLLQNCSGI